MGESLQQRHGKEFLTTLLTRNRKVLHDEATNNETGVPTMPCTNFCPWRAAAVIALLEEAEFSWLDTKTPATIEPLALA